MSVGGKVLAAGRDHIDQGISLSAYEGGWTTVRFVATDSAGQQTALDVAVAVESSARLSESISGPGPIWDVQPDRILCYASSGASKGLIVRNRIDGQDTAIPATEQSSRGFLTPGQSSWCRRGGPRSWCKCWSGGMGRSSSWATWVNRKRVYFASFGLQRKLYLWFN